MGVYWDGEAIPYIWKLQACYGRVTLPWRGERFNDYQKVGIRNATHPEKAERVNANHFVTMWLNQDGLSLPDALYRTTEEKDKSTTMINACSN